MRAKVPPAARPAAWAFAPEPELVDEEVVRLERTIKELSYKYGEACERLGTLKRKCILFEHFVRNLASEYEQLIGTVLEDSDAEMLEEAPDAERAFELEYDGSEDDRTAYIAVDARARTIRAYVLRRGSPDEDVIVPETPFSTYQDAVVAAARAVDLISPRIAGDESFSITAFLAGKDVPCLALDATGSMFHAYVQAKRLAAMP